MKNQPEDPNGLVLIVVFFILFIITVGINFMIK